jgi:hypothetical protein
LGRETDRGEACGDEIALQALLGAGLAVHQDNFLDRALRGDALGEGQQVVAIGVGREAVERDHLRPELAFHAEDANPRAALDDAPAEGLLGLEPHDQNRVLVVLDHRLQVVHDPPAFAHAARGDDDGRVRGRIDGLRLLGLRDVVEAVEVEHRLPADARIDRLAAQALRVQLEDIGDLHAHRRVEIHRHGGDPMPAPQSAEGVQQLLGALQRERRDQHLAAAIEGAAEDGLEVIFELLDGTVQAVAVGTFHHQDVDPARHLRRVQQADGPASQIARVREALADAGVVHVEQADGAAEDMPRVEKAEVDPGRDRQRAVVRHTDDLTEDALGVGHAVQRLDGLHVRPVPQDHLVDVACVRLLNHRRVEQHHGAQISRRRRRVDGAFVPLADEQR